MQGRPALSSLLSRACSLECSRVMGSLERRESALVLQRRAREDDTSSRADATESVGRLVAARRLEPVPLVTDQQADARLREDLDVRTRRLCGVGGVGGRGRQWATSCLAGVGGLFRRRGWVGARCRPEWAVSGRGAVGGGGGARLVRKDEELLRRAAAEIGGGEGGGGGRRWREHMRSEPVRQPALDFGGPVGTEGCGADDACLLDERTAGRGRLEHGEDQSERLQRLAAARRVCAADSRPHPRIRTRTRMCM
jgi:hypothetical protein